MTPLPRCCGSRDGTASRASTRAIGKIQRVASSITQRDQLICIDLHEHRVLTTEQLYELHFSSIQRARSRLLHLYELGVLWRTRPHTQHGSLPWHYILNEVGSWIVAEYLGIDPREVGYRCIFGTATRTFSYRHPTPSGLPHGSRTRSCTGVRERDISSSWTTSNRSWSLRHPECLDELGITDHPECVG